MGNYRRSSAGLRKNSSVFVFVIPCGRIYRASDEPKDKGNDLPRRKSRAFARRTDRDHSAVRICSGCGGTVCGRHDLTPGTLIAVFLSTSDEMLPIMISEGFAGVWDWAILL